MVDIRVGQYHVSKGTVSHSLLGAQMRNKTYLLSDVRRAVQEAPRRAMDAYRNTRLRPATYSGIA
jgi:hypothetical protein